jgi:hypothetical protein
MAATSRRSNPAVVGTVAQTGIAFSSPAGARPNGNELLTTRRQAGPMPVMMPASYQLIATRVEGEVLRRSFDDRDQANQAVAEALLRYRDCEIRLTRDDSVLISAGTKRSPPLTRDAPPAAPFPYA